eukprot:TRINITY_DN1204_c1_g1_i1.p1 TRINITY_DN1204_c1_g1~~TRINITY_DN1204_c1_g1_i1.p1  ORF type:complete len:630 (-),score=157.86 TRINITY_DN1204_c1_g1_i1:197-2023(-)
MAMKKQVLSLLVFATSCTNPSNAGNFLQAGPSMEDAERILDSELHGIHPQRLAELEDQLNSTFIAMPKGADGHMEHQAVRYVLHRLFVDRHGWYIRGLEPTDTAPMPGAAGAEWVPAFLQGLIEQRFGAGGVHLRGLAALAAALEDLISKEAEDRLGAVYKALELEKEKKVFGEAATELVQTYMMGYLKGMTFETMLNASRANVTGRLQRFSSSYPDWDHVASWVSNLQKHFNLTSENGLDFASMMRVAEHVGEEFAGFNEHECRQTKSWLLKSEDTKEGRVRLKDFYARGLLGHWEFTEKPEYLKVMGALDDSDPQRLRVIVPNYVASRTNCLEVSSLYTMCCFNECEELMSHLEKEIAAPLATPTRIATIVKNMSSDTVKAPRELSSELTAKLQQVASNHGGKVPLHGRLFAQWMHHAFPRECPFPHEAGTTGVQTPDEWLEAQGEDGHKASESEMMEHIGAAHWSNHEATPELPWSETEVLVASHHNVEPVPKEKKPERKQWSYEAVFLVVTTLVAVAALMQRMLLRPTKDAASVNVPRESMLVKGLLLFVVAFVAYSAGLVEGPVFLLGLVGAMLAIGGPSILAAASPSAKASSTEFWKQGKLV